MKKIYIAGRLNDDACAYLKNVHRMIKLANEARAAGFSVFVPCNDLLQGIVSGTWNYRDYFDQSQPWLMASDAVLVVEEGWRTSNGTRREMQTAENHKIPIFFDLKRMIKHFEDKK